MGTVGVQEMVVIFLVALVLFGPKKLPELGRTIGKAITEFRRASNDLKATFEREMHSLERETQALKETTTFMDNEIRSASADYSLYEQAPYRAELADATAADPSLANPSSAIPSSANPSTVSASEVPGAESQGTAETASAETASNAHAAAETPAVEGTVPRVEVSHTEVAAETAAPGEPNPVVDTHQHQLT
jgi:TatA/E family protein of Tat protein translocase